MKQIPDWVLENLKKQRDTFVEFYIKDCDPQMRGIVQFLYDNYKEDIITIECCQGHGKTYNKKYTGRDVWTMPYIMVCCTEEGWKVMNTLQTHILHRLGHRSSLAPKTYFRQISCFFPAKSTEDNSYTAFVLGAESTVCKQMKLWNNTVESCLKSIHQLRKKEIGYYPERPLVSFG